MSYLINAAIKGIVEGFTEFLPISSTGHLVLLDKWLPLSNGTPAEVEKFNEVFDLIVQFPAILAIVVLYRYRLWKSISAIPERPESRRFWISIMLAFVPIGIAGLVLKNLVESLRRPEPIAIALIVGGLLLLLIERAARKSSVENAEHVPFSTAISIGVLQCLALFPGVSRSGATIVGGRMLGLNRVAAAEFSFFLALPTMTAACGYKMLKDFHHVDWHSNGLILAVGCITSFITAISVVALFIKLLETKYGLSAWGWYRILLGLAVLTFARSF